MRVECACLDFVTFLVQLLLWAEPVLGLTYIVPFLH